MRSIHIVCSTNLFLFIVILHCSFIHSLVDRCEYYSQICFWICIRTNITLFLYRWIDLCQYHILYTLSIFIPSHVIFVIQVCYMNYALTFNSSPLMYLFLCPTILFWLLTSASVSNLFSSDFNNFSKSFYYLGKVRYPSFFFLKKLSWLFSNTFCFMWNLKSLHPILKHAHIHIH